MLCVDNFYTGSMENIRHLLHHSEFTFKEHDITDPITADNISFIFNLACPASPIHYQEDAIFTTKTSVVGTLNLLDLARKNSCPILQASTSEVYGNPHVHPQTEDYYGNVNPIGIRSCYDEGKRCAESLCMDYYRQYGIDVKIIRIFNTYGPRMAKNDGRVVSNFIVQALQEEDITIYGDGNQGRSFQYIDDLIEAIFRVMKDDVPHTPINIGNPNEISVKDLADMVLRITKSKSAVTFKSLPQDDPCRRKPDINLAIKVLDGWTPQVCLTDGLKYTIDYFRDTL